MLNNFPKSLRNIEFTNRHKDLVASLPKDKKNLITIIGKPESFSETQECGIFLLTNYTTEHNIKKPSVYATAQQLALENYDEGLFSSKFTPYHAGCFYIDILESCPPANQNYVANIIHNLIENNIFGIITTMIPKKSWKSNFNNFELQLLYKGVTITI